MGSVVGGVETTVGTSDTPAPASSARLAIKLLGAFSVERDGVPVALPQSRKVRSLLGYLALAERPVTRERLCELFWPVPNDPRGELRWTLSKLRAVLEGDGRPRIVTSEDRISLDLDDCRVDVAQWRALRRADLALLDEDDLAPMAASWSGEFLEGLDVEHSAEFDHWLLAQRAELRMLRFAVIGELCRRAPVGSDIGLHLARQWLEIAPLDAGATSRFLHELVERQMVPEALQTYDRAAERFRAAGVDFAQVIDAWQRMRGARRSEALPAVAISPEPVQPQPQRRASVAVMPFREMREGRVAASELGDALAHDAITKLARLRSLFIIARGSVFAIADENLEPREVGARLGVDYVATGLLQRDGQHVRLAVEVAEAETSHILWAETFEAHSTERFAIVDEISDGIVASIALHIETAERDRALLKHPESLDAWECYHRGLWHMYQFMPAENRRAAEFFTRSIKLDPTFSRAYAGLSFTHWQNAFQRWDDSEEQTRQALASAARSLLIDEENPSAHWSMGRALWLTNDCAGALQALQRSVELSPNFALGHYALSFVHSLAGDPTQAIDSSEQSRLLSPCDPLLFGMLGTRAIALVRLGSPQEGAEWALRAASRPNAHVHILALAAHCLAVAGRIDEARDYAARIKLRDPAYRVEDFLTTFRFAPQERALYVKAGQRAGI
ncbi:MAG: transcriptional regulator [Rhizobiaceae bacterium]|nr:transcriptional regulator [Rhizobiaceae bacterium]